MSLLVTVDVERGPEPDPYRSVDDLDSMISETDRWTFFVTPDVVKEKQEVISQWLADGHSVGMHIHPERITDESDWLSDYTAGDIKSMLTYGCKVFKSELGFKPTMFRAGRWEHSSQLVKALESTGFEVDCSLLPDQMTSPYRDGSIIELPLTVYTNGLLKTVLMPWTINGIPQTIDNFLKRTPLVPGYYAVAYRTILQSPPYFMIAFHDYDTTGSTLRKRMRTYIDWLDERFEQEVIGDLNFD
jgi:peptidoglycan/xylan/chitin deacetylase (PgdA/CDA1 family)